MQKYPLICVSICAVVLLVLASLSNVVGYQTVESSHQTVIHNEVNQRELVFQTILDIANNKEIQGILLREKIRRGEIPDTTVPVLSMKQLKQMYLIGLILSKTISKVKMHSFLERYQINNQKVQKEINVAIEKNATLKGKNTQLLNSNCNCENENTTQWTFPIICTILFPMFVFAAVLFITGTNPFLIILIGDIAKALSCFWAHIVP